MSVLRPKLLAISGGISPTSYNRNILNFLQTKYHSKCEIQIYDDIEKFPFFISGISLENSPEIIKSFLRKVNEVDGILICSPEYVYSIPGVLKNALEWVVSSVVFTNKPTAIITAASVGEKAHESLQLILKTIGAKLSDETSLLISGVKGKVSTDGQITDSETNEVLERMMNLFISNLLRGSNQI